MTMFGSQWLANAGGGYEIAQSCRFNDDDSSYMTKTFGGAGDGTGDTCTYSVWLKRGNISSSQYFFSVGVDDPYFIGFQAGDTLRFTRASGGSPTITTTAVFRDCSAWYHIVLTIDTSLTAVDRWKIYVNNVRQTVTTGGTLAVTPLGTALPHYIGRYVSAASYFDGYMAEINFVDGTALDPSSFGETNDDGVWVPIKYTGAYGTNGFYITGEDSADLGADYSGNSNDFTSSGLATNDQVTDSPTLNYCTLNPLFSHSSCTFSNGNLDVTLPGAGTDYSGATGSFGVTSGKWYWEVTPNNTVQAAVGILTSSYPANNSAPGNPSASGYLAYMYRTTGTLMTSASWDPGAAYGDTYTTADVIGIALDLDAGTPTIEFFKNNTSQGSSTIVAGTWLPGMIRYDIGPTYTTNFGQSGFTYTPPAGFLALNTSNLPEPTIKDGSAHFQTALHTGTGSSLAITQSGNSTFTPDLVWIKGRSATTYHAFYDVVRGVQKDQGIPTGAETTEATGLTAFNSNGAQVGALAKLNTNAATYADWMWKGGGASVSNAVGTLTSQVSANTTAGISVVTYTGTGAAATVGHGLGISPSFIILRRRDTSAVWYVWHTSVSGTNGNIALDGSGALSTNTALWNTGHTSTTFGVGNYAGLTANTGLFCAYVFAPIAGFSAFGSYTGNGSTNGPMVNCGFRPAFVMTKRTNSTSNWAMWDTARDTFNVANKDLVADATNAEPVNSISIDILSNGFKLRTTSNPNASGGTYIYMAFAEHPFGGADTAPATAR